MQAVRRDPEPIAEREDARPLPRRALLADDHGPQGGPEPNEEEIASVAHDQKAKGETRCITPDTCGRLSSSGSTRAETATVEENYEPTEWSAEKLLGRMAHCTDIVPNYTLGDLDMRPGRTYAAVAQQLLRERRQERLGH